MAPRSPCVRNRGVTYWEDGRDQRIFVGAPATISTRSKRALADATFEMQDASTCAEFSAIPGRFDLNLDSRRDYQDLILGGPRRICLRRPAAAGPMMFPGKCAGAFIPSRIRASSATTWPKTPGSTAARRTIGPVWL